MRNKSRFANLSLLGITLVWGATFTLTKNALTSVSVFPFLTVRFALATVVLLGIVLMYRPSRSSLRQIQTWRFGVPLGIVLFLAYAFQTLGLGRTGAAVSGFITGLNVILVPLISIPLYRRIPSLRIWLGVLLAVVGLALLSGPELLQLQPGDTLVLGCTVFLAVQILMIERYGGKLDSLGVATIELGVVAIGSFITSVVVGGPGVSQLLDFQLWLAPSVLWAIVINAVLGTSIAYWAQNVFQRYTSAAQIAIIFSMEPVFAAIIAWLALREQLSGAGWVGGALIFVSMLIADSGISWTALRRGNRPA